MIVKYLFLPLIPIRCINIIGKTIFYNCKNIPGIHTLFIFQFTVFDYKINALLLLLLLLLLLPGLDMALMHFYCQ